MPYELAVVVTTAASLDGRDVPSDDATDRRPYCVCRDEHSEARLSLIGGVVSISAGRLRHSFSDY